MVGWLAVVWAVAGPPVLPGLPQRGMRAAPEDAPKDAPKDAPQAVPEEAPTDVEVSAA